MKTGQVHKILFVRTDRIGDVLMNLPALRALRLAHPKSWIALATSEPVAPLLKGHPDLDEIISVHPGLWKESASYRWKMGRVIRKADFDAVVVSNPDKYFHFFSFMARIPLRVGYARKWPFFLNRKAVDRKNENVIHEIDANLALARLAGAGDWDGRWSLPFEEGDRRRVAGLLPEGHQKLAVIHAGTSNVQKKWEESRFSELARRLHVDGFGIVLIGGPEEKQASKNVAKDLDFKLTDLTGILSLRQLSALFAEKRVVLMISADSGPAHISWIHGVPSVILYAKNSEGSNPMRWGPRHPKSEAIWKSIHEISVDEVFAATKKVLN